MMEFRGAKDVARAIHLQTVALSPFAPTEARKTALDEVLDFLNTDKAWVGNKRVPIRKYPERKGD